METVPAAETEFVILDSQKIDGRYPKLILTSGEATLQLFLNGLPFLIHVDTQSSPARHLDATTEIKPNYSLQIEYEICGIIAGKNPEARIALRLKLTLS